MLYFSGITETLLFLSQVAVQYVAFIVQLVGMLLVLYLYQGMPISATLPWFLLFAFLQAGCGMCAGFLISLLATDITRLTLIVMNCLIPTMLLSSTVWPLEGIQQEWLMRFCQIMPTTWATEAARSILLRGWGPESYGVWQGYVSTLIWIGIFIMISISLVKVFKTRFHFQLCYQGGNFVRYFWTISCIRNIEIKKAELLS